MTARFVRMVSMMLLAMLVSTSAYAQTSSIAGVVTDAAGGVVPGATVTVLNNGTKETLEAVTNAAGQFSFPGVPIGTYTVTVSLAGFKTFVANDVRLLSNQPGAVNATLEVGDLTEKVEVKAGSELVQTQSASVSSTLSVEQLSELPLSSRNALYSVALLPGVTMTGGPRAATINGLPNNTINVTIDGVNTGNMLQSTDGLFSMVTPRMDAVEEVTVNGAVPGAGAGPGSVQVAMTTRSGSNQFDGSGYYYWRDPVLNTNYFFNKVNELDKNDVVVHQYGFRQGGPIVLPGLYDGRGKAFFFFNFERFNQPSSVTRTRTLLRPEAQTGQFNWSVTTGGVSETRSLNVMALAAANGQIASFDPLVQSLLNEVRAAAGSTGTINDIGGGTTLQYVYQSEGLIDQYSPTGRVDFNLSDRHRLSGSYWWQRFLNAADIQNSADANWPGFPNYGRQDSYRTTGSSTLRSTFGKNIVNELRGGWQWSPNEFFSNVTAEHFANQDGLGITFPGTPTINTSPTVTTNPQPRNTTTWSIDNTLNWLRGAHSISMGGGYAGLLNRQNSYNVAPTIALGFDQNLDPARAMFSTANFPGATATQLNEARNLYALLTGRVTGVNATARLDAGSGKYVYMGDLARKSRQDSFSAFIQDAWRVNPTLTLNAGLRWDLHEPFTPADNTWSRASIEDICGLSGVGNGPGGRGCNIFNPNVQSGQLVPTFEQFEPGDPAYKTNWLDFAPNVGVAWRPDVQDGWMRKLLGDPEQATIRAGYAMSYNQERIDRFTANSGANEGGTISANRNNGTGFPLVLPGESHPVLLSQRDRLGPPAFPQAPVYPINASSSASINIFPDDLSTPRVHSYSLGFQRSLGSDMALEVRYVGNKNLNTWAEENWNERSIFASGFYDEFRKAQANLAANVAGGKGNTFAYTGIPGTSPLPIHLAYLNGSADVNNPAAYASANFSNSAFYNRLSALNPQVFGALQALDNSATFRTNAVNAGMPRNLIVMNPSAGGGAFVVRDDNWTKYNSVQLELRRRLNQGLLVSGNYTYGIRKASLNPFTSTTQTPATGSFASLAFDRLEVDTTDTPHVFKMNWVYEIPVGRGKRFGSGWNPIVDAVLGNWQFSGDGRLQTQRFRMSGVKLEGMSVSDLQKEFKISQEINPLTGRTVVFSFPEDIRTNTIAAFSVDPTSPTGYSAGRGVPTGRYIRPASDANCIAIYRYDCNTPDINLNGPLFSRWDMRLQKRVPFGRRASFEFSVEMLNVFDTINFTHSVDFNPSTVEDTFRVTSAYTDINATFDPGGRVGQLVWRINW